MTSLDFWLHGSLIASSLFAAIVCIMLAASSYGSKLPVFARFCIWSLGVSVMGHAVTLMLRMYLADDLVMSDFDRIALGFSIASRLIVGGTVLAVLVAYYKLEYAKHGSYCQLWKDMSVLETNGRYQKPKRGVCNV